jgi:hypothetical protein
MNLTLSKNKRWGNMNTESIRKPLSNLKPKRHLPGDPAPEAMPDPLPNPLIPDDPKPIPKKPIGHDPIPGVIPIPLPKP